MGFPLSTAPRFDGLVHRKMPKFRRRDEPDPRLWAMGKRLAAEGEGEDDLLTHINRREALLLQAMGGAGTRNPRTGLPQFDDTGTDDEADASAAPTPADAASSGTASDAPPSPPGSIPGVPVKLPNGDTVPGWDPDTKLIAPPDMNDLSPVAEEGRRIGETYWPMMSDPSSVPAAMGYLAGKLGSNLFWGGKFDYQRDGGNLLTGFNRRSQFQDLSNFNVGLLGQQAGLSLDDVLRIAGTVGRFGNATPKQANGLTPRQEEFTRAGYNTGASGLYGPAAGPATGAGK